MIISWNIVRIFISFRHNLFSRVDIESSLTYSSSLIVHKHDLHHNNHEITHAICHKVAILFPELYSVEGHAQGHKAGMGKAARSPHVASSPVIPGA